MYSPTSNNPSDRVDLSGGGAWKSMLLPDWPFYSQMHDWTADGQTDENRSLNCGPECTAMIVDWLTGIELPADYIKDIMLGQGIQGVTGPQHIRPFLTQHCATSSTLFQSAISHDVLWYLWKYLTMVRPSIVLMRYNANPDSVLHWRVVIGMSPTQVYTADPWDGTRKDYDYNTFSAMFEGMIIAINRTRCIR